MLEPTEKKFKVRMTKLPDHWLSSSHGRKEEWLVMNIYTVGQIHHSKDKKKLETKMRQ